MQPPWPLEHLTNDTGTFVGRLPTTSPQAGDVQKDVGKAIVGRNEPVAFSYFEPLDGAGDFKHFNTGVISVIVTKRCHIRLVGLVTLHDSLLCHAHSR